MDKICREMTFEEEAVFYEKEAREEFAKETGGCDCSYVNGILRRGMRIIRKARQEIANREVVHCVECKHHMKCLIEEQLRFVKAKNRYCCLGERKEGE
jgi:hypothetical protein